MKISSNANRYSNVNTEPFRLDSIWDQNAPRYNVACQSIHVTTATRYIAFTQLVVIAMFAITLVHTFATTVTIDAEREMVLADAKFPPRYFSSMCAALGLQTLLVMMLIHGVQNERRNFLLPYVVFASLTLFVAVCQVANDLVNLTNVNRGDIDVNTQQIMFHALGLIVHTWCTRCVCKCFFFIGDKKVAQSIGQQLQTTTMAFSVDLSRPPPYTALPTSDKQPLTVA